MTEFRGMESNYRPAEFRGMGNCRTSAEDCRAVFGAVRDVVTDYLTGAHWTLTSPYILFARKVLRDCKEIIRANMEPFIRNREALSEFGPSGQSRPSPESDTSFVRIAPPKLAGDHDQPVQELREYLNRSQLTPEGKGCRAPSL